MATHASNRMNQVPNPLHEPREAAMAAWDCTRESITEHPGTAVFTAFAAGLGIGLGLALAFSERRPPRIDESMRARFSQFMNDYAPWART